jgi:transcription-repair coupling factor (superfamily II helicase)
LQFEKVDIIENPFQFSVVGDRIDIAYGKYVARLLFFGEVVEDISIRDYLSYKLIFKVSCIYLTKNRGVSISSVVKPISSTFIHFVNVLDPNLVIFDYVKFTSIVINKDNYKILIPPSVNTLIISNDCNEIPDFLVNEYKIITSKINFPYGFYSQISGFAVLTGREIFGQFNLNLYRTRGSKKIITDFIDGKISKGDYIVHIIHGIGRFRGIILRKNLNGKETEYLDIEYAQGDRLYIPIEISDRITKYIGTGKINPKLTRLGTMEWERLKGKVKKDIEIIAKDLILTQAKRFLCEKTNFNGYVDDFMVKEFDSKFDYELTDDQNVAIQDVIKDIESNKVMDRVIVGDVGFGKTEIAIRAAFRVVSLSKQVIMLAPTTILARQHFDVFKNRFNGFPFNIELFSRDTNSRDIPRILDGIKKGSIDIIIGTHKLLSDKVIFMNPGLVIVDEEQRFGVKQKEKLKNTKVGIDYLSLSATPIPRTLYSAFSGIRDISVISTPPKGRKPIETYVINFDWSKFAEIINQEVNRGGQIYFLHNNIYSLGLIKSGLEELLPNVSFVTAFGGMPGLSSIISKFKSHKIDVLIATTIIENGIDIPNVNTIILNQAYKFGLSQLYQIRGRVGRSSENAFCYLVVPEDKMINSYNVSSRINALLQNQYSLGRGFEIAVKDLEIRGSGNLLGVEQHGNINRLGFDLYTQLLQYEIGLLRKKSTI